MSPEIVPWLTLCGSILTVLIGFVWHAAATKTSHNHRLNELEKGHGKLIDVLERLNNTVTKIDKHLSIIKAVDEARVTGGQFDLGSSDPPPPHRK